MKMMSTEPQLGQVIIHVSEFQHVVRSYVLDLLHTGNSTRAPVWNL